ncbi:MAG: hypothetical protein ABJH45_04755 [Paracoccaceae bacterium]
MAGSLLLWSRLGLSKRLGKGYIRLESLEVGDDRYCSIYAGWRGS